MTQDTKNKFAELLAAAQTKASDKTTPNFSAPAKQPEQLPETPKPAVQELSGYTIEDILTGCEPAEDEPEVQEHPKNGLKIVDYSDRAFAVISDTKPANEVLDVLRQCGGTYNRFLKCGKGWIFSKRHLQTVKAKLSL